jgi:hypothetical protein
MIPIHILLGLPSGLFPSGFPIKFCIIIVPMHATCSDHHILPCLIKIKLTNEARRNEGVWGNGCIDPGFHDLGTSWR